jgi:outer membrane autotransporter protein
VPDTNQIDGEVVTLDASASTDADGEIVTYQWFLGTQLLATGVTATVTLGDGESFITLVVTDDAGNTGSDAVLVTVAASPQSVPTANAGPDRSIADSDADVGESVALDGSGSSDTDGTLVSYRWMRNGLQIAAGSNPTVRLPDGVNVLTLVVVDDEGNTAADVVQITIARPAFVAILSALPGLSENQMAVAVAMDTLCPRLQANAAALVGDQQDLLRQCNAITFDSTPTEQARALDEITPEEMNAVRTQTLNLSRSQLGNLGDRLAALRKGAKGLSLVGLNLNTQDSYIPAQQVATSLDRVFGGGASADDARESLFNDRVGIWLRGNYSFGDKSESHADHGFEADQWALLSGLDYRFTPDSVIGIALGYGRSQVDFNPTGAGELATSVINGAIYATMYSQQGFYVDAIASLLQAGYDSVRRLEFTHGGTLVDLTARGDTKGSSLGFAFTLGYDFNLRGFTIAPSVGYNYLTSTIDGFREAGAAGLDLAFEQQTYVSGTANAGLRMSYAWRTKIGVLMPQVRGEYIREFIDERETFGVRFANDPFADTPLMIVQTDVPDRSYWRLSSGFAAQFAYGISAFVEYQRLNSLRYFDYADVALGLRFETAFE